MPIGNRLIAATRALIDTALSYDTVRLTLSHGSTFVAGVIEGTIGLPSTPLEGFESTYRLGQAFGAGLGLTYDAVTAIKGVLLAGGGGALAVSTNGVLLPVGAAAAAQGSAMIGQAAGLGLKLGDVIAKIPGLEHGAGFLLYVDNGSITALEGYTFEEPWPVVIDKFTLTYTDPTRPGLTKL